MNKTTCKGRKKRNDPEVCFGWTHEWTSPRRIGRNKRVSVREIVRGPFSSPKLIRTWPFVLCSLDQQLKTVSDDCCPVRRGIPDAWREYLACKGLCGTAEITELRKNLIPSCIRSVATDRLWNQVGLPLVQGIPDPWKSKPIRRYNSNKCPRQRQFRNKHSSPRTGCVYDGDDEAEIERGAEHQFNKKREKQKESILTERETLSRDRKVGITDKDKKGKPVLRKDVKTRVPSSKVAEPSQSRKNKGVNGGKMKDCTKIELKPKVGTSKEINLHAPKVSVPKKTVGGPSVKKKIQTVAVKKTSATTQTVVPTAKQRLEKRDPVPRKNLGMNTSTPTQPQNACCNCLLKNYMTYLSGFSDRLKNPENHVLCKDCENAYYKGQQSKIPVRTARRFCTQDPKSRPTIYEWTKLKFCDCVQKARERFGTEAPLNDRCNVKPKGTFASKEEMKLTCYCCDSPYLRIQNTHAKTHHRKKCTCRKCTCKRKQRRTEQNNPKDARERRRSISCSTKHCGTGSRNKTHAYKFNVQQPSNVTFKKNEVDAVHWPEENGYKLDLQTLGENVRRKEDKKEKSRVDGNVETNIPPLCEMDSNITILYCITDSGEEADISEYTSNNINGPLQITRVSSLTYIQKVRNAALNKLSNQCPLNPSMDSSSDLDEYVYIYGSKTGKD